MNMQRIIVLGGTGWLGTHLTDLLRQTGRAAISVSRSAADDRGASGLKAAGSLVMDLGCCTDDQLDELIHGADVIVNCTDGMNSRDGRIRTASELQTINSVLVKRLTGALDRTSRQPLFLHMGSILEYGPPHGRACAEDDPCSPTSDYSRSKLLGSMAALEARRRGHDVVVLRLANLIGPRPALSAFPGILTSMLRRAQRTGEPTSLTITSDRRDFLDVRDAADAVLAVIDAHDRRASDLTDSPGIDGRERSEVPPILNISSGRTVSIPEFVNGFVQEAALDPALIDITLKEMASMGGGLTWADPRLARSVLCWSPQRHLGESLNDMWNSTSTLPNSPSLN